MKRIVLFLTAVVLLTTAGPRAHGQPAELRDRTAHPPIHVRGSATQTPTGYSPSAIQNWYGFSPLYVGTAGTGGKPITGAGQVIAIIDAYDDPTIAGDLQTFISMFGLPGMKTSNCQVGTGSNPPCFQKIYAQGKPRTNGNWALEISLDVEWAHAIAPGADILLVEAQSNSLSNLLGAVAMATNNPAVHAVSMSWGAGEFSSEGAYDSYFSRQGVMFVASSGDSGSATWPAASPNVVGVGGTMFKNTACGTSECTWNDAYLGYGYSSGGGTSPYESEPAYQTNWQNSASRGIPDVAYYADIAPGYSVYDSTAYNGQKGWFAVGGTSAGAPQWAALFALVDQLRNCPNGTCLGSGGQAPSPLYGAGYTGANYTDITVGCNSNHVCAGASYDFVTGIGSPQAQNLVVNLSNQSLP
jgi:subtilase family serine protease